CCWSWLVSFLLFLCAPLCLGRYGRCLATGFPVFARCSSPKVGGGCLRGRLLAGRVSLPCQGRGVQCLRFLVFKYRLLTAAPTRCARLGGGGRCALSVCCLRWPRYSWW